MTVCSVDGCTGRVVGGGYCERHYRRWRRYGDPTAGRLSPGTPLLDRVMAKIDKAGPVPEMRPDLGPCWLWTDHVDGGGYGVVRVGSRMRKATRVTYELLVGPIPDGLEPDHLCRVRGCVNPKHIEPTTHRENVRRGTAGGIANARKTHCKRGHPFDAENTRIEKNGSRTCRRCCALRAAGLA